MSIVTENKIVFSCDVCEYKTTVRGNFFRHKKVHIDEHGDRYTCSICEKQLSSKSTLKKHMKIHTGEAKFSCKLCFKTFAEGCKLSAHIMMIHTEEKNFQCGICGKSFFRKSHLVRHMMVHTGEKKQQCAICSRSFPHKCYIKTKNEVQK
jgi:KRAB domain-containing zinc finger protein